MSTAKRTKFSCKFKKAETWTFLERLKSHMKPMKHRLQKSLNNVNINIMQENHGHAL